MNMFKAPVIEIHGTGTHNRGAELMAIAISEKIKSVYPNAKIVVPCTFGHQADIKKYNFLTSLSIESKKKAHLYSLVMGLLTGNTISVNKIDAIIDASGFAFSDQWGEGAAKKLVKKKLKPSRNGKPLIILPQAMGPFENTEVKTWVNKLFNQASIIYARDDKSYNYCKNLITHENKLLQCPDFTVGLTPKNDKKIKLPNKFVCIVPNIRMTDKLDNGETYIEFIRESIKAIKKNNLTPVFLIHDAQEDLNIVKMLGGEFTGIEVVSHDNPQVLKWILGQAYFVIGSRFHALVSSLSQGVPCIGAGWSHKYPELFRDFNTADTLIDELKDLKKLNYIVEKLSNVQEREYVSQEIKRSADDIKIKVDEMWKTVFELLDCKLQQR